MLLPKRTAGHTTISLLLIIIFIVGAGLLAFLNILIADDEKREGLKDRAETIAYALDANLIEKLSGTKGDENTPAYKDLKTRLNALKEVNTDARSLYLAGMRGGQVFFYVDSESPGSEYFSTPGEKYEEASVQFQNLFGGSPAIVEGPLTDSLGTWVSSLAPIVDTKTGKTVAVIGIDVAADEYNQTLIAAAAPPVIVASVLIIVVMVYEWMLRRGQRELQMRSELVSIASHELRTPVTGIRWAAESLLKQANASTKPLAQAIYDSVIHLQAGVEDILQLSRVTRHKDKLTFAPCNMTKLVEEIIDTQKLAAQQRGVKIVMDDSWPKDLTVNCDAEHFKRALHNIVSNAVKYTQPNTDVTLRYEKVQKMHRISVKDHGIGIPEAEQDRVFAGFYRASNAKAQGVEGTGLGLYLTRVILTQHKGKVEFVSKEGAGTTFTLSLPAR
ncbi:MAG: sensor histidine kinase [Candidatus Saccharimonadales bacterium]